jgi:dinuclear metal center YbgI/SA1388 family protein
VSLGTETLLLSIDAAMGVRFRVAVSAGERLQYHDAMPTVAQTVETLEQFAPPALAAEWDNVGLLVGDPARTVTRLMTCLTLTPTTVKEAVSEAADLVVVHHPLPFRPVQRLTTESTVGRLLLALIEAQVAVYSPHTAFDSAREGINQCLAEGLGLDGVLPLTPSVTKDDPTVGTGRIGQFPRAMELTAVADRLKAFLRIPAVRAVGDRDSKVRRVAIACGSGGSLLDAARLQSADCFVTGEATFHTCLEAEAIGMSLLLVGHYASERFALDMLADFLTEQLPDVRVWSSRTERDPLLVL